MKSKLFKLSIAALLAGSLGFAGFASATPQPLVGGGVDSGWSWEVAPAAESLVNLVFIRNDGGQFVFEKDVVFVRATDPIVITFTRTSADAKTLVINDEAVVNHTGVDWSGFRMELSSGSVGGTPNFAFVTSDGAPGIGDFKIDPFTQFSFYGNNSGLLLDGGTVKNNTTWFPGSQSDTGLALVANANGALSQSFSLKEIPIAAAAIPLPAAAWSGLGMLFSLGLIASRKRLAHCLA